MYAEELDCHTAQCVTWWRPGCCALRATHLARLEHIPSWVFKECEVELRWQIGLIIAQVERHMLTAAQPARQRVEVHAREAQDVYEMQSWIVKPAGCVVN